MTVAVSGRSRIKVKMEESSVNGVLEESSRYTEVTNIFREKCTRIT